MPDKARFVLHTTVGRIEIGRLSVIGEGQLLVQGRDEATQEMRFLCFAEEQALLFPIEVKDAGAIKKGTKQLGFTSPSMRDDEQTTA